MKFKGFMTAIVGMLMIAAVCGADTGATRLQPSAFLPAGTFTFPEVVEGTQVLHEFRMLNKGKAPLNILRVETG